MKETLTSETATSTAVTLSGNADAKVRVSSDFVGAVWIEFLIPGETVWGIEPGSVAPGDNSFELVSNDATVQYRFNSHITDGSAVVYIDGTEVA
jgi:hypothetical protein